MNPEEIAQPSLGYSALSHYTCKTSLSGESTTLEERNASTCVGEESTPPSDDNGRKKKAGRLLEELSRRDHHHSSRTAQSDDPKPIESRSTPLRSAKSTSQEHSHFLREMEQAREELTRFRTEMSGLAKQMNGIALDIKQSKKRISEDTDRLEQDLTATQEANVNLQVLLENALKNQKESDVFATQAIRTMHFDLASVVQENNGLQGRLASIESHLREHNGSLHDVVRRIQEYIHMLEQAQGTIHMLQEPRTTRGLRMHDDEASLPPTISSSRRTSETFSTSTDEVNKKNLEPDHELPIHDRSPSLPRLLSPEATELYRYRFVHRRISLPPTISPPQWQEQMPSQEDLRVLWTDRNR
ncbi:hypothetical protein EC973_009337 [Apophysomyces ossiformis]|uniref:Uncharacterized protein n=1 Tax=Apophysomyces ossiformis TaxID=679940 RepID=A0A8H7ESL7_9FUNG|nr:hypothetical protein EC973_009337 [Apophysomyces ossiformis]